MQRHGGRIGLKSFRRAPTGVHRWRGSVAAAAVLAPTLVATAAALSAGAARSVQSVASEPQVRAAVVATLEAWTTGDFESLADQYHHDARGFFLEGAPLARGFNPTALQMAWDAGLRADVSVRDLDVQVHDGAAVAVAYVDGTLSLPGDQPPITGTWRYSETRIASDGAWKIVQYHFSPLADVP